MTRNTSSEDIVGLLKATGALQEGHFALSSGLHSGHYLQCALFLMYPENAALAGSLLAREFARLKPSLVVSPALGGVIIGHEVAKYLGVPFLFCEREQGKMKLRRFSNPGPARYVIVEDVVTSGKSVLEVKNVMDSLEGTRFLSAGCIADRGGGLYIEEKRLFSLVRFDFENYNREDCPLCKRGIPLSEPGSRRLFTEIKEKGDHPDRRTFPGN